MQVYALLDVPPGQKEDSPPPEGDGYPIALCVHIYLFSGSCISPVFFSLSSLKDEGEVPKVCLNTREK